MKEYSLTFLKDLGLAFLLLFYGAFVYGVVVYKFYYWFLLPVYDQLPFISFKEAISISAFLAMIKTNGAKNKEKIVRKEGEKTIDVVYIEEETNHFKRIAFPWVFLFLGWLIKVIIFPLYEILF